MPTIQVISFIDEDEFDGTVYKTAAFIVFLSGDFYLKEAYKGFYVSAVFLSIGLSFKIERLTF